MDINQDIATLSTIRSASVVLVPPSMLFRSPLTEASLLKVGCTYSSDNRAQIDALKNLLLRNNLRSDPSPQADFDLRNAVYLTFTAGVTVKILLGEPIIDQATIQGSYQHGASASWRALANPHLVSDLQRWASSADAAMATRADLQDECARAFGVPKPFVARM